MKTHIKRIWREFKRNYYSKIHKEYKFKNNSRTDQYITTTEEVIYLSQTAYGCNKMKKNFILNIWKHKTGIKINFDLC